MRVNLPAVFGTAFSFFVCGVRFSFCTCSPETLKPCAETTLFHMYEGRACTFSPLMPPQLHVSPFSACLPAYLSMNGLGVRQQCWKFLTGALATSLTLGFDFGVFTVFAPPTSACTCQKHNTSQETVVKHAKMLWELAHLVFFSPFAQD